MIIELCTPYLILPGIISASVKKKKQNKTKPQVLGNHKRW